MPQGDSTLQSMDIVGERLVLTYLRNAASEIEVRDLEGKLVRKAPLPPLGTSGGHSGNPDGTPVFSRQLVHRAAGHTRRRSGPGR